MLARCLLRPFVPLAVFMVILVLTLYSWPSISPPSSPTSQPLDSSSTSSQQTFKGEPKHIGHPYAGYTEGAHREIFSVSTADRKYFKIDFSPRRGINPNAIPHPTLKDHWVIVGQLDDHPLGGSVWFAELVCTASFKGEVLTCIDPPLVLSIGKTPVRAYLHDRDSELRPNFHEGQWQLHW
jgi:hypothetical protein